MSIKTLIVITIATFSISAFQLQAADSQKQLFNTALNRWRYASYRAFEANQLAERLKAETLRAHMDLHAINTALQMRRLRRIRLKGAQHNPEPCFVFIAAEYLYKDALIRSQKAERMAKKAEIESKQAENALEIFIPKI